MSNEPNKPIEAQKLTDKELECVTGGGRFGGGGGTNSEIKFPKKPLPTEPVLIPKR